MPYSSNEMLGVVAEINCRRIAKVYGKAVRLSAEQGEEFTAGPKETALLMNARTLHNRYEKGEYHHTEIELGQIVELMNILVQRHAASIGAVPRMFDINLDSMVTTVRLNDPRIRGRLLKGYHYEQVAKGVLTQMG